MRRNPEEEARLGLTVDPRGVARCAIVELPSALIEPLTCYASWRASGPPRIAATVTVSGQSDLPADVQVALYRIAQETMNNVAKHSGASEVQLTLRAQPGHLEMRIADDGRGFDANVVSPDHLGLGIMRERAEGIGARMKVDSEPGEGTEVIVVWPG
jgi:nitrate/nitrite-specific signal transduction histidine kinase